LDQDPSVSASSVAGITDVHHHAPPEGGLGLQMYTTMPHLREGVLRPIKQHGDCS
jgi:hypothetical protein